MREMQRRGEGWRRTGERGAETGGERSRVRKGKRKEEEMSRDTGKREERRSEEKIGYTTWKKMRVRMGDDN